MPRYPYFCPDCGHRFEIIKSLASYDDDEFCEVCKGAVTRQIGRVNFNGASAWNSPQTFNPAFGCVVRGAAHQREILARYKDQGREMQEVGNEPVENIHKYYDQQREAKQQERWAESAEQVIKETLL